jgi:hypothetical protein
LRPAACAVTVKCAVTRLVAPLLAMIPEQVPLLCRLPRRGAEHQFPQTGGIVSLALSQKALIECINLDLRLGHDAVLEQARKRRADDRSHRILCRRRKDVASARTRSTVSLAAERTP